MTNMELLNGKQTRKRAYKFVLLGISCITIGVIIYVANPLELIVDSELSMREGSLLFNLFAKPPLEVYISAYIFNITNFDRFRSGMDKKLKVQEVGPYVFLETLENRNATIHPNLTLSYRPIRTVKFIREKSCGDPTKDVVTVPNIPYMGVTTAASKLSIFAALAARAFVKTFGAQVVLNLTVHDYFWGYDDPLIDVAAAIMPNKIKFKKFGLLDRLFDEGENLVFMNLPGRKEMLQLEEAASQEELNRNKIETVVSSQDEYENEVMQAFSYSDYEQDKEIFKPKIRDFSIDMWNGGKGMPAWGYQEDKPNKNSECNTLRGTYDGTLFPRRISKGEVFRIYRKPFCRTLPIVYSHPGSVNGIDAYYFKLAENAFDTNLNDSTSSCFCTDNVCLKKGLGNVTPCYYNIPSAASFPHFYNADPSLLDGIDGLSPNEEKHGSEIVLQPQLGVPMRVHSRLQVNLLMGEVFMNPEMIRFKNMAVPIFWVEIAVENLTLGLQILLHLLFNVCPYVQTGAIVIFILAGISILATTTLTFFKLPKPIKDINPKQLQKRYSAMYLFPYIRRELSKIGDEEFLAA